MAQLSENPIAVAFGRLLAAIDQRTDLLGAPSPRPRGAVQRGDLRLVAAAVLVPRAYREHMDLLERGAASDGFEEARRATLARMEREARADLAELGASRRRLSLPAML
jgi:hypothetical protein